jgi:hypothetical protein
MPEILWIALVQRDHGHRRGVELITSLARAARANCVTGSAKLFAAASSFATLSQPDQEGLLNALAQRDELSGLRGSLDPLVSWYPQCPLRFLFADSSLVTTGDGLQRVKAAVSSLYDRDNRDTMLIQATVIWLAFDADVLKVAQGLALAQFPEIERYPDTELSQKVGSGVRATLNMLFGSDHHYSDKYAWPGYFWNRGLAIEKCEFPDG